MSDVDSIAEQRTDPDRETRPCPVCEGDVREPRSGDAWHCDNCARRWLRAEFDAEANPVEVARDE